MPFCRSWAAHMQCAGRTPEGRIPAPLRFPFLPSVPATTTACRPSTSRRQAARQPRYAIRSHFHQAAAMPCHAAAPLAVRPRSSARPPPASSTSPSTRSAPSSWRQDPARGSPPATPARGRGPPEIRCTHPERDLKIREKPHNSESAQPTLGISSSSFLELFRLSAPRHLSSARACGNPPGISSPSRASSCE
jgi:hypothetical protein